MSGRRAGVVARTLAALLLCLAGALPASAGGGPGPGQPAPAFSLRDQHGTLRGNADYAGRWLVLYFYPRAFTGGCTEQVCAFRDDVQALRAAGARVVGVSLDAVAAQKAFAERHQVPFPLLSDAERAAARSYGVLERREGRGDVARRETFLIDADGIVVRRYRDVDPQQNVKQVLADIAAFNHAHAPG